MGGWNARRNHIVDYDAECQEVDLRTDIMQRNRECLVDAVEGDLNFMLGPVMDSLKLINTVYHGKSSHVTFRFGLVMT